MEPQISKNTLFNFFAGHATPLQKKVIEEWLGEEANRELFFEWLKEWETEHPQFVADPEAAFRKLQAKRRGAGPRVQPTVARRLPGWGFTVRTLAAAVALVLLASLWIGRDAIRYHNYRTAFGEIRTLTLADGSRVVLNANSSLRVPRFGFGKATREVVLAGEAQFLVRHTPTDQKFIVRTPDRMAVEVLGTEFVVYSRKRGSRVILQKGSVQLRNAANRVISVAPGDVVTLDKKGVFQKKSRQPVQNYSAWKENRFVFDRTSLREVAHLIAENFGTRVRIPDTTLARQSISGTFRAKNAREMLDMVADVSGIEVIRSGQGYLLQPASEE
ncbi:MAG: FecR domain-containing protein [Cytophagales bacterium]|nr:FecR domain-containing protein [Cytophagales bacterium]